MGWPSPDPGYNPEQMQKASELNRGDTSQSLFPSPTAGGISMPGLEGTGSGRFFGKVSTLPGDLLGAQWGGSISRRLVISVPPASRAPASLDLLPADRD